MGRANASAEAVAAQLNAYESALKAGDIRSAASSLAQVADRSLTVESLRQANALLGFKIDEPSLQALVDLVQQQQ